MNEDERNTVMKLVRDAYNEAFLEGMKESTSRRGGNPFDASRASRLLSNYLAMWIANEDARSKRGEQLISVFGPDKPKGHYGEWCRDPSACAGKGYCPKDQNCGD